MIYRKPTYSFFSIINILVIFTIFDPNINAQLNDTIYLQNGEPAFFGKHSDTLYSGEYISYYYNFGSCIQETSISTIGYYKDGLKHGKWTSYSKNNQKEWEVTFKKNKIAGKVVWYHENGSVSITGYMRDSARTKKWTWFYDDGNIELEGRYRNGVKTGKWKNYNESGKTYTVEAHNKDG